VSADAFRTAYQTEFQALARRARQSITPEQARALGLEQRVLARLVAETALDQTTKKLGLSVSDAVVVRTIETDQTFQGANGTFDRAQFAEILRSNGLSEAQYVREQRAVVARQQVSEAVSGSLPVPLAMREAVHRYQTERRTAEFVTLPASSVGEIAAPTDAELQAFYDGRKALYRAPEYRSANLLLVDPDAIAKPEAVSEDDARSAYERIKDTRFGTPERRAVQQITFPTRAEAETGGAADQGGRVLRRDREGARDRRYGPHARDLHQGGHG
jgi:peptidyl-prolyl cis-trans isomerase D